ncbi:MAG: hypothetical protein JST65_24530, partial [Acidobacteria bacterium]|nr:hypothetical protein [Acidobacteriota bacterium]
DFSGPYEKTWESGPDGAFQVTTGAPVSIIRRIGYHSAVIRQADVTGDLRIILRALPNGGRFPTCAGAEARSRASSYELRMAQRTEVNRIVLRNGDDTHQLTFHIKHAKTRIRYNGGPMWGISPIRDADVAGASALEDATYWIGAGNGFQLPIHVSRWTSANGRHHRAIDKFGDQFAYRNAPGEELAILDPIMDSVCVQPPE